ncbi:MAG: 1,4-alpha-glucan branching protein GlgB [Pseudomonadota bacterium]
MSSIEKKHQLSNKLISLQAGKHGDPFAVLGKQGVGKKPKKQLIRVFLPWAEKVILEDVQEEMLRIPGTDIFEWGGKINKIAAHYLLRITDKYGNQHIIYDAYSFGQQTSEFDLHLFAEGKHQNCYEFLGANSVIVDGIEGVLFATWAPNARRVSVIGDFNNWDGRCNPMRALHSSGIWEIFIPNIQAGELYKYEILNRDTHALLKKTDPYGRLFQKRPDNASIVCAKDNYLWQDDSWIEQRKNNDWLHQPMSIYELHLGSWQRDNNNQFLNYRELAHRLVEYVKPMGFTHIELLPITEHPLDISWGYQTTGYFAPTSRFGTVDDFRYFIDYCHQHQIGVLLDWVPAHFPKDDFGLAFYDGSALYEHEDPRKGEHRDWGTKIFNFSRFEVKNFLISSALFWIKELHLDGLRVDAVASMLYLDYSREEGDWIPNQHGGNENLEAIDFVRELNHHTHVNFPGTLVIAEESTSWPQVTRPGGDGGLGFSMKWNMGWMHDILSYFEKDPIHRRHHHNQLTFGMLYAFTENFVLPFSHDEVVHGKYSMLEKMAGDDWQKFANLRLLYTLMFTYPGKKLLFMGCEFAQRSEWNVEQGLSWDELLSPYHKGIQTLVADLNKLYVTMPALHYFDFEQQGFNWIECNDSDQSVISYQRKTATENLLIILNFTPVPRKHYRVGVPQPGVYQEILNSDSSYYQGSNISNGTHISAESFPWMGMQQSIVLDLPPLGALILQLK